MKTPEQSVIELIKQLRAKGVAYNTLMRERDRAENGDDDEDDDTVHRSTESIDREIDEILDDTMTLTRQLICDKDTDGDGDCHECHRTGGCPKMKAEALASEESASGIFTVIGYYDDSGLRYVGHHRDCESAAAAILRVGELYPNERMCVVAVLAGEHKDLMEGDYLEYTDELPDANEGTNEHAST